MIASLYYMQVANGACHIVLAGCVPVTTTQMHVTRYNYLVLYFNAVKVYVALKFIVYILLCRQPFQFNHITFQA